jgi:peptidoglycan/LPS O-acetylase OafA/YrhL
MAFAVTPIIAGPPADSVAAAVADSTGISGVTALSALVAGRTLTPWPFTGAAAAVVGIAAAVLVLTTARRWPDSGRRYRIPAEAGSSTSTDPIDSWDALSRGADPTRPDPAR